MWPIFLKKSVFQGTLNLTDRSKAVLLLWILFVICVSCLSVILSCLFLAGWERTDLLALLYVMFSCIFVTFPYGVLGQVWYLMYRFLIFAFFLTFIRFASFVFLGSGRTCLSMLWMGQPMYT